MACDVLAENATNSVFLRVTAGVLRLLNSSFNTIAESNIATDEYASLGLMDSNYNILFKDKIARLSLGGEGNIVAKNSITRELNNGGLKNSIIANRITQLNLGSNSTSYANNIIRVTITGADNLFYANNFQLYELPKFQVRYFLGKQPWEEGPRFQLGRGSQFWDNGKEGDYWRTYKGFDADNDGIINKPYTIEAKYYDNYLKKEVIVDCGIDNYPLMSPFDIESVSFKLPDWALVVDSGWAISFLSP